MIYERLGQKNGSDERKRWIITWSRLPGNLKYSGSHVLPVLLFRYLWSLWSTHTEGKVINVQGKFYTVNAPTEKEAQELAKAQFIDEYGYNGEIYISEARKLNKFTGISMVSMIMAILLSFINWKLDHSTVSIKPDLISCIMAFAIYSAYVLRIKGLQRMTSYIDLVFMVLLILLFSSFIQCILLNSTFSFIIWDVSIDCWMLLIIAAFLIRCLMAIKHWVFEREKV